LPSADAGSQTCILSGTGVAAMAIDKSEKFNEAEERENARQARAAWLRAAWRAHPVLVSIGVVLLYALTLFKLFNDPVHHRGASLFVTAGIFTAAGVVFLLVRLWWRHHRAKSVQSDWT
jgi:hypothetical protein